MRSKTAFNLQWTEYALKFKRPAKTSRDTLTQKISYILVISDPANPGQYGVGECSLLPGLSIDKPSRIVSTLNLLKNDTAVLSDPVALDKLLKDLPALRFGIEMALCDLNLGGQGLLFPSNFTDQKQSIQINGLVWMGPKSKMIQQVRQKIESGFRCLKLKVGGIAFEDELSILKMIRHEFSVDDLEIRLDANGAFSATEALSKLDQLACYHIHSIEQPIQPNQWLELGRLCCETPIPIALDEELIGRGADETKYDLLKQIKPQYIILKPSLLGGFKESNTWISIAESLGIPWWATSALESNIGLNAISQWAYHHGPTIVHGLGTGHLFTNNFVSKLALDGDRLHFIGGSNSFVRSLFV